MHAVQKPFFTATKGKVVIAFLFAAFSILLAWGVSKFVFREILGTIDEITAPNDKLKIVNRISHQIASLDHLQRNSNSDVSFFATSQNLRLSLDTLSILYHNEQLQLKRISALRALLKDRDVQFVSYLNIKEKLLNTQSFSDDVQKLNELLAQKSTATDSTTFTTQTSTSTTTMAPEEEEKSRGFLARLFGKKKAEVYQIISEEYKIKRDTVNPKVRDSVVQNVTATLKTIAQEQRKKSNTFLRREGDLADASGAITSQMLSVLKEVEAEALSQLDKNSALAKSIVNDGVQQMKVIIIVFFLITIVLGYLILADITKNNRYRLALERAKDEAEYHGRAKQRFLSNMSHEIRTPLQSILGYSELVATQAVPEKQHLKAIHQSATHLLQIVNEVLDYNRIISGEFVFEQLDFELENVLDEVVDAIKPLALHKGISLVTDFDLEDANWINGDSFRLKQILYNLLGNAIKFTRQGEVNLLVETKELDGFLHCYFTVKDTGIGFDADEKEKIFNEFEQSASASHRVVNQNGTGLGLAIVKTLVDAQNGRITVNSKLGEGSTFSVYLKYPLANGVKTTVKLKTLNRLTTNRMVWLIDDDQLIIDLCKVVFGNHKVPFRTFTQAAQILTQQVDENLAYVLIDMRLDGITGIELHDQLKAILPNTVKFYAVTAQVLPDERAAVLARGFDGILMKPFNADKLLNLVGVVPIELAEPVFDDSFLLKMTMGDNEAMAKILASFIKDCKEDEVLLLEAIEESDWAKMRLVTHRLAGRTAQIGAKELGAKFRNLEQVVAAKQQVNDAVGERFASALTELKELTNDIAKRLL